MKIEAIDFETHFYPQKYIELLKSRDSNPRLFLDAQGRLQLKYNDIVTIPRFNLLPKFTDATVRMNDMRSAGVRMQIVSIPIPGCDLLSAAEAETACKVANDGLASLCQRYPECFAGLAAVPVQGAVGMKEELSRAIDDLGMRGVILHSNAFGKMFDAPEYAAVFELAQKMDVPVFLHPTVPFSLSDNLVGYNLLPTFGFESDLTTSLLRLIYSGILVRLPGLKVVAAHLGSMLPMLAGRVDDEFDSNRTKDMAIDKHPSIHMRNIHVDTVTKHPIPLDFALRFYGEDRIIFGSDYPFWDTTDHVAAIENSSLGEDVKQKILYQNATRLLKL